MRKKRELSNTKKLIRRIVNTSQFNVITDTTFNAV